MSIVESLLNLKSTYADLEEGFYTSGDFPLPPDKYIKNDPYLPKSTFDDFRELLEEIDELLGESTLTREILELIEDQSPIAKLVNFNKEDYAADLLNGNIEAYDENLSSFQEDAAQRAYEKQSELLDEALEDIQNLMEHLLPRLIRTEN